MSLNGDEKKKVKSVIGAIDIGTTKVVVTIGSFGEDGLEVIGVGTASNSGMRQGSVVNIDATSKSIQKAREEAELMAGVVIDSVWISVGGPHIESFDSSGMVAINNGEIAQGDIERVIEAAQAIAVPADRRVLHVLPSDFKVDKQGGITDPIGMSGVRLEASVHIVTGNTSTLHNSVKCVERVGLRVSGMVLQQLASARSILSADEKNLGVAVVDMGGGTCDLVAFMQGSAVMTDVVPVGGNNFTHDIAMGLKTSQADAEVLKKKWGCALVAMTQPEESVQVEGVGGRSSREVARKNLASVIEARAEETLLLIRTALEKDDLLSKLGSGIVLTGGASQLNGLVEMGDFIFDVPVRLGVTTGIGGLKEIVRDPSFATSIGLLQYGWEQVSKSPELNSKVSKEENNFMFSRLARKMKDLLVGSD
ncbi:MAG: cell division protein FtsA [Bdellovibrionales bacterium]|nr:cell division protein FtsA [Bdellovibrionales bacterium]